MLPNNILSETGNAKQNYQNIEVYVKVVGIPVKALGSGLWALGEDVFSLWSLVFGGIRNEDRVRHQASGNLE